MKKKITAIALAVCILAVGIIGATMSYFTDTDEKTNVFTMGKVDITLTEESEADLGDSTVKRGVVGEDGVTFTNVLPNEKYAKKPIIKNETDSNTCWVAVEVTVKNAFAHDDLFVDLQGNWTQKSRTVGATDTVYRLMYGNKVEKGNTVSPFTKVQINPELTKEDASTVNYEFTMKVIACAVQAEGLDATAAYAQMPFPTNISND